MRMVYIEVGYERPFHSSVCYGQNLGGARKAAQRSCGTASSMPPESITAIDSIKNDGVYLIVLSIIQ